MSMNHSGINLRIGSRGSALALVQANRIKQLILDAHPTAQLILLLKLRIAIKGISLQSEKGVFVKEIEQALLDQQIDIAVHSFKDITSQPIPNLSYGAFYLNGY